MSAVAVLLAALALRRWLFSGFILGDDAMEFVLLQNLLRYRPNFHDQLTVRFGVWLPNYVVARWFGLSEATFFLPTWVLSAALAVVAYVLLVRWGHPPLRAFLAALIVASAPFEVLLGTVRANDLFLTVAVAAALLCFFLLERRPVAQGASIAVFAWYAFYVKLWAVYLLVPLAGHYAWRLVRHRQWRAPAAFVAASLLVHGATAMFWKARVGLYVPTLAPEPYAIPPRDLAALFLQYPTMVLRGSEFGTTLFGAIPWLAALLLAAKLAVALVADPRVATLGPDRTDAVLFSLYATFFLLLEVVPTGFALDRYYSVPRIFRYLSPFSFLLTLHVAKMACDVLRVPSLAATRVRRAAGLSLVAALLVVDVAQARAAVAPGRLYRRTLLAVVDTVRREAPPRLVAESWIGSFLRDVYLVHGPHVVVPPAAHSAKDHEIWLSQSVRLLPPGTLLLTGLASYVHYGAHYDGFRLSGFAAPLDGRWQLVKEFDPLTYLPRVEPARLWRLSAPAAP